MANKEILIYSVMCSSVGWVI